MLTRLALLAALPLFAACGSSDGIDSDGAVFDGIASEEWISASGSEPFWKLELKPVEEGAYEARFEYPDVTNARLFTATRFAGNNGLGFSGRLDGVSIQVAITPGDCRDDVRERIYPFHATVALGETTLTGCAYTSDTPFTEPEGP